MNNAILRVIRLNPELGLNSELTGAELLVRLLGLFQQTSQMLFP